MGKKRVALLGDIDTEEQKRQKRQVQREQKDIRQGRKISSEEQIKLEKVPGMKGGERVVDTTAEALEEFERVQAKSHQLEQLVQIPTRPTHPTSPTHKTSKRHRSSRYLQAKTYLTENKAYPIAEALNLIRKINLTRFPASVELHLNLVKTDAVSNQTVELPHSLGKSKKVAVFNDELAKQLDQGIIDFDILLAKPSQMPQLVKFAKLLGPRGLMPNPKSGTIVDDPDSAIPKFSADNRLEIKIEKKEPLIHTVIGKLNMQDTQLTDNLSTILNSVGTKNIHKAFLTTTMSPSIRIEV